MLIDIQSLDFIQMLDPIGSAHSKAKKDFSSSSLDLVLVNLLRVDLHF